MTFVLGVVLFALGIGVSVALHEAGHMYSAKAFGMKVRRYFIGFGPTLFSFRRGETEYGLKLIPAGGFCDIAGMTALEELADPRDHERAFYRFATWKRVVVLSAGPFVHFALGIVLVYVMAVSTGLPNLNAPPPQAAVAQVKPCITTDGPCAPNNPSPALKSALQPGDRILAVRGVNVDVRNVTDVIQRSSGPTEFVIERDAQRRTVIVDVAQVPISALGGEGQQAVGAVGIVVAAAQTAPATLEYGPLRAVPETFVFSGMLFERVWDGLLQLPSKVPALLERLSGEDRPETPVSLVGASILGGDAAEQQAWWLFLLLLAALNFFVGVMNLLPLLPFDGGHIAINVYERARNRLRQFRGRPDGPPVDYSKLQSLTVAVFLVIVAFSTLTLAADVINPIRLK